MRTVAIVFVIGISVATSAREVAPTLGCGCIEGEQVPTSQAAPAFDMLDGNGVRAHDPAMAKEGRTYYMFCTGPGISFRTSTDRTKWSMPIRVFDKPLPWTTEQIKGFRDFYWAPDVSYFNHKWHLYYAVSTFGKNRSAIGLATNVTLDPKSHDYKWIDEGPAFQSYPTDSYNAIDPNIAFDEKGQPWISFGSFWSGLKILRIDPLTGKPEHPNEKPIAIAGRPSPGAVEAPFIIRHGRYFYLFASYDFCCRGVNSTYNVKVGRSEQIAGPYLDRDGKSLLNDGGTPVLSTTGRWHGPGGNSVLRDGHTDLVIYHAYDAKQNGAPMLRIDPIKWDRQGWPIVLMSNP